MMMKKEVTLGTRVLNGFLSAMVIVLVFILASVVISLILALFGILK